MYIYIYMYIYSYIYIHIKMIEFEGVQDIRARPRLFKGELRQQGSEVKKIATSRLRYFKESLLKVIEFKGVQAIRALKLWCAVLGY